MKHKLLIAAAVAAIATTAYRAEAQSFRPANGWVNEAAMMLDAKEWQKGTERTRAALRTGELTAENHAAALNNLCIGLTGLTQYSDAMEACLQAIEISPRQWQSYNNLANIYFYLNQYDRALAQYYKALSFRSSSGVLLQNIRLTLDARSAKKPSEAAGKSL
ncbi:MAG: tetratricopeptide repeat protein [Rhodospirillaceae bacterium]|nr:tetratricopeptide repeat protein [Rhodospirillaceae bacterium]